jgi:hypothetical protein
MEVAIATSISGVSSHSKLQGNYPDEVSFLKRSKVDQEPVTVPALPAPNVLAAYEWSGRPHSVIRLERKDFGDFKYPAGGLTYEFDRPAKRIFAAEHETLFRFGVAIGSDGWPLVSADPVTGKQMACFYDPDRQILFRSHSVDGPTVFECWNRARGATAQTASVLSWSQPRRARWSLQPFHRVELTDDSGGSIYIEDQDWRVVPAPCSVSTNSIGATFGERMANFAISDEVEGVVLGYRACLVDGIDVTEVSVRYTLPDTSTAIEQTYSRQERLTTYFTVNQYGDRVPVTLNCDATEPETTRQRSLLAGPFWLSTAPFVEAGVVELVLPITPITRGPNDGLWTENDLIELSILKALETAKVILFRNSETDEIGGFPFNQRASLWDFSKLTCQLPRGTVLPVYSPWSESNRGVNRELKVGLAMALLLAEGDDKGTEQIESLIALVPDRSTEENEGMNLGKSWVNAIVTAERSLAAKAEYAASPSTIRPVTIVTPSGVVHEVTRTAWMGDEKGFAVAFDSSANPIVDRLTGLTSEAPESVLILCLANVSAISKKEGIGPKGLVAGNANTMAVFAALATKTSRPGVFADRVKNAAKIVVSGNSDEVYGLKALACIGTYRGMPELRWLAPNGKIYASRYGGTRFRQTFKFVDIDSEREMSVEGMCKLLSLPSGSEKDFFAAEQAFENRAAQGAVAWGDLEG